MYLYVNNECHELPDGASLTYLLEQLGLSHAKLAVEVNHCIVPKHKHKQFLLHDHDRIEIIQAIGGG